MPSDPQTRPEQETAAPPGSRTGYSLRAVTRQNPGNTSAPPANPLASNRPRKPFALTGVTDRNQRPEPPSARTSPPGRTDHGASAPTTTTPPRKDPGMPWGKTPDKHRERGRRP